MDKGKLKGHAALWVANIVWGLNAPIGKSVLWSETNPGGVSPFALSVYRMVGAALLFWAVSLLLPRERVAPRSESMRLMVLVPMVKDAVTLCKRYKNIEMVNIGNAGKMTSGEKKILSKEVMLTADELEALKELTELYPDTFFQGTPAMEKKMASAILKGC